MQPSKEIPLLTHIYLLAVVAIFLTAPAFSGTVDGTGFYIQPAEPNIDVSNMTTKPMIVLDAPSHERPQSTLPTLEVRDKVFTKCGLTEAVSQLDNFDRDSIYLRLRSTDDQTIERIIAKFPQLQGHEKDLKQARRLITTEGSHE